MKARLALLAAGALSLLLTGCPLTDHYELISEDPANQAGARPMGLQHGGAGGDDSGSNDGGGETASGASSGGALDLSSAGALDTGGGTSPSTCCGSVCTDLTSDVANCGACGAACSTGRACVAGACQGGWVTMSAPPAEFVARSRAAIVTAGKQVFFWGGQDADGNALDNGAVYDPSTDTWTFLPTDTGTPSARLMASAVWTGTKVIVFGGTDAMGNPLHDGAIYNPGGNQWTPLAPPASVSRRSSPYSYWDGTRAIFWGGLATATAGVAKADRFDLAKWSSSTNAGDPGAIAFPTVGFDGATLYLLGGLLNNVRQDKVYSYKASTDTWTSLAQSGLTPRSGGFGVWEGSRLVVWGGRDDNGLCSDGAYFAANKWTPLSSNAAPTPRMVTLRRSGWSFEIRPGLIALLGGQISTALTGGLTTDGATYDVDTSVWSEIAGWPSTEAHDYGMGVWTGAEFVLWGGRDSDGVVTSTGERWAP